MEDLILKATEICIHYHYGQKDKAGNPYFLHPFAVSSKCKTEKEIVVALLHDILEDTDFPVMDILTIFGQEIFDAVVSITKGKNESYFKYIKRCSENELARKVKIHDLEHNLENRGYEISESLKERYNKALEILVGIQVVKGN